MDTKRTLVIVRHAQAEAFAADDHQRSLTPRGEADARALGAGLAHADVSPDAILVSDATRARATWLAMLAGAETVGAQWRPDEEFTPAVYTADADYLLQLVRERDEAARTLVVVGHNPTVASLALLLDDGEGDATAAREMAGGFPTASRAVFTVHGAWAELSFGTATLRSFAVAGGAG